MDSGPPLPKFVNADEDAADGDAVDPEEAPDRLSAVAGWTELT